MASRETWSDGAGNQYVKTANNRGYTVTRTNRKGVSSVVREGTYSRDLSSKTFVSVLKLVLLIVLLFSIFSQIIGTRQVFTFGRFLDILQKVPSLDGVLDLLNVAQIPSITGDWGVLDFIRLFINLNITTINSGLAFLVYIGTGLVQILSLVFYFMTAI